MRYSNKKVRRLRKRMEFVPEISFHKDCHHRNFALEEKEVTAKDKELQDSEAKERAAYGEKSFNKYQVRYNDRRKKRNPHRRLEYSVNSPEFF